MLICRKIKETVGYKKGLVIKIDSQSAVVNDLDQISNQELNDLKILDNLKTLIDQKQ